MADFRVATNWLTHPKTLDGIAEWGEPFIARIIRLWAHTSDHYPDGDLKRMSKRALGMICQCDDPRFLTWLIENGWIDETETGMSVHDWAIHQPWLSKADERSEQARINGKIGAAKRWGSEPIATPIAPAKRIDSEPIAPSPSPSPSPSPEEKDKTRAREEVRPVSEIPPTKEQTAQIAATNRWNTRWNAQGKGSYLETQRGERAARDEICAALDHDVGVIESMVDRFFVDDDDWLTGKRNWHTFKRKVNEYRDSNGSGKRKGNDKRAIKPAHEWQGESGPVKI